MISPKITQVKKQLNVTKEHLYMADVQFKYFKNAREEAIMENSMTAVNADQLV